MDAPTRHARFILSRSLIAVLCSILVGLIRYGTVVFNYQDHRFAFVVVGLAGALFFFTHQRLGIRSALALGFVCTIVNSALLTKRLFSSLVFYDILSFSLLFLALYVFRETVYRKRIFHPLFNPIVLGSLMGLGAFLTSLTWIFLHGGLGDGRILSVLHANLADFFIGLGIGIGIYLADRPEVNARL
jgi:hypothetical protein